MSFRAFTCSLMLEDWRQQWTTIKPKKSNKHKDLHCIYLHLMRTEIQHRSFSEIDGIYFAWERKRYFFIVEIVTFMALKSGSLQIAPQNSWPLKKNHDQQGSASHPAYTSTSTPTSTTVVDPFEDTVHKPHLQQSPSSTFLSNFVGCGYTCSGSWITTKLIYWMVNESILSKQTVV